MGIDVSKKFSTCLLLLLLCGCGPSKMVADKALVDQQDEAVSPAKEQAPAKPVPFLYGYGEGEAANLADAKLKAFEEAEISLINEVLMVADRVAKKDGVSLGLTDAGAFLLRFHGIVEQAMHERQVDMETVQEAVKRQKDGKYRYMIDLRLSKAFVMQEIQQSMRDEENALPVPEERFLSAFAQSLRSAQVKRDKKQSGRKEH